MPTERPAEPAVVADAAGRVVDISHAAGVDWLDATKSGLILDLDNDGDQDIVICIEDRVIILSNDGTPHFEIAAELEGPSQPHSITAADYDDDGLLDLYVCGFWLIDLYDAGAVAGSVRSACALA